jgi:hypothetical protein
VQDADGKPLTARDTRFDEGGGGSEVMQHLQALKAKRQLRS